MRKRKVIEEPVPWIYKNEAVLEIPKEILESYYGFIYCITNIETGKIYIGKKILRNSKTKWKHVLNEKTGRMNKVKDIEYTESNWKNYWGSCKELITDLKINGKECFKREILYFVPTKKQLTYFEVKEQIVRNVLEPTCSSYNENILSKFFRKDLEVSPEILYINIT